MLVKHNSSLQTDSAMKRRHIPRNEVRRVGGPQVCAAPFVNTLNIQQVHYKKRRTSLRIHKPAVGQRSWTQRERQSLADNTKLWRTSSERACQKTPELEEETEVHVAREEGTRRQVQKAEKEDNWEKSLAGKQKQAPDEKFKKELAKNEQRGTKLKQVED